MELAVFNTEGNKTSKKVSLSKEVFGIEPNDHAIYLDVKRYLAAQRQGTHKAKERSEVAGSTRKIKKQKGTGTARAGDIKNPLFRGGGRVFGPRPRKYELKLNKKVKQLARKSALSYKAKENQITVLDKLEFSAPKTSQYAGVLKSLKSDTGRSLVVLPAKDDNVYLSSRNLKGHNVILAESLSTYDIMNCTNLILLADSVKIIEDTLNK
ncbi:50S ribosomal protein L4 [Halocola ammonii]